MPPTDKICMLSNQELSDKLRQYGITVGPIVQSTRGLYENKLRKLVSGEVRRPKYEEVPYDENTEDEEEAGAPVEVGFRRPVSSDARYRVPTKDTPLRVRRDKQSADKRETMSGLSPVSHRHASFSDRKEESKKGFPVWTLLFIFLIVAVLGYIIVKNMEADAENSIPNQIDVQV